MRSINHISMPDYTKKRSQEVVDILAAVFLGVLVSLSLYQGSDDSEFLQVALRANPLFWSLIAIYVLDWLSLSLVLQDGLATRYFVAALLLILVEGYTCALALNERPKAAVAIALLTAIAGLIYEATEGTSTDRVEKYFWVMLRVLFILVIGVSAFLPVMLVGAPLDKLQVVITMSLYATYKLARLYLKWPREASLQPTA